MQTSIIFYLNKKQFEFPCSKNLLDQIPSENETLWKQLFIDHKYEVQSPVQEETFRIFLNFWQTKTIPKLNSKNIWEFCLLSNEFGIMKDHLSSPQFEDLYNISYLIQADQDSNAIIQNSDKSVIEKKIAEHLNEYLARSPNDLFQIPINSLYNIFSNPEKNITDYDEAYNLIVNESQNKNDLFVLIGLLDGSQIKSQKIRCESILLKDEHLGFCPKNIIPDDELKLQSEINKKLSQNNIQLVEEKDKIKNICDQLEIEKIKLTEFNKQLTDENEKIKNICDQLDTEKTKLAQLNKQLTTENEEIKKENEKLAIEKIKLTQFNKQLTDENGKIKNICDQLETEKTKLTQFSKQLTIKNEKITKDNEQLNQNLEQLKIKIHQLNQSHEEISFEFVKSVNKNQQLMVDNHALSTENEQIAIQCVKLSMELERLQKGDEIEIKSNKNNQLTIPKAEKIDNSNNVNNNTIVILRPLRNRIYDELSGLTIEKTIVNDKSKYKGVFKDLIPQIITNPKCSIISFFIEYYKNDYVVRNIDLNNNPIQDLPPYLNVQIKPDKGTDYRICTLLKEAVFDINLDINKDCYSFAVKLNPKSTTLVDFYNLILNYLFRGKKESKLIDAVEYQPLLYTFVDNKFKEIESIDYIRQNEFKPIFVVWISKESYDFVTALFTNTMKEKNI